MLNGNSNITHPFYWGGFVYYLSNQGKLNLKNTTMENKPPNDKTHQVHLFADCMICCIKCLLQSVQVPKCLTCMS